MKEKFLKAIEDNWHDGDTAFKDVANQCTKISIEEKIELLESIDNKLSGVEQESSGNYLNAIIDVRLNLSIEIESLQTELKQLSK
jgi:glycine cleavage system regulatory protein